MSKECLWGVSGVRGTLVWLGGEFGRRGTLAGLTRHTPSRGGAGGLGGVVTLTAALVQGLGGGAGVLSPGVLPTHGKRLGMVSVVSQGGGEEGSWLKA